MSSNYYNYHRRQFNHYRTQPLPDPELSFRTALPHRIQPPPDDPAIDHFTQGVDRIMARFDKLESRWEEIDRRVQSLQASKAAYGRQPYADGDSGPPRRRPTCWDPPFQTSSRRVGETRAPPLPEPPLYWQPPYTDWDSSYKQPRQYTTSTVRHPPYSSDVPPRNPHAEYHQWRHEYKSSRSIPPPPPPSHRRSAAPLPAAAAPPPPRQSDRPPQQSSLALSLELPSAKPHPQVVVPSSLKKEEEELLDNLPSPPAVLSPSCNPNFSRKNESLLEDGIERERTTVEEEKSTSIMKETNLHSGDKNGLMEEVVNCLHQVTCPSVMVYAALTCAGGSKVTREVAWVIFDEGHHIRNRAKDVVWQESVIKVRWKENSKGPKVLVVGKGGAVSDIIKITLILLCAFDPGIYVRFSTRHCEFLAMQMAKMDLRDGNGKLHTDKVFWNAIDILLDDGKELPHKGFIKCLFVTETISIELKMPANPIVFTTVQKFDGDYEGRHSVVRCGFDPGGEASSKFLLSFLVVASWFPP